MKGICNTVSLTVLSVLKSELVLPIRQPHILLLPLPSIQKICQHTLYCLTIYSPYRFCETKLKAKACQEVQLKCHVLGIREN